MSITVVIPTHPGRGRNLLDRAVASVWNQTLPAANLIISVDTQHQGAGATRQRGLEASQTEFTAFLDSDDEFLPDHLATLHEVISSDPDCIMAFSWFEAVGMQDPLGHFGLPFDPAHPYHTTVTTLVRTSVAKEVGGFPTQFEGASPGCLNDDWIYELRMCEYAVKYNKKIIHVPKRTWRYYGHSNNSSGKPGQGDA